MGFGSWLGLTSVKEAESVPSAELSAAANQLEILTESMAELELALEDGDWQRMTAISQQEFSRAGLGRAAAVARVVAVSNPLLKRGLAVRQAYVWGQGVQISARAGADSPQDVNQVVQDCLDDEGNKRAWCGPQAREEAERSLGTDGNVFHALFAAPLTGALTVRTIPFDEMTNVIANPDDRADVWFFERRWHTTGINETGYVAQSSHTAWYPALGHDPANRIPLINGSPVDWTWRIHHTAVNGLAHWQWGIGDAYAALPWARAYKDFLGDWATLVRALSRFAWRATAKGSKAQTARAAIAAQPTANRLTGEPNRAGATVLMSPDSSLEAIPKTGATIDSESGKPLAGMIAAALEVPVTILLCDPGQTGARAVAETLDKPTELAMGQRRERWTQTDTAILNYAVDQAVKAPRGPLRGIVSRDQETGRETVTLALDADRTIDVVWPPLNETPPDVLVGAIVAADSTSRMPPELTARLLMQALGVDDVDSILADMMDADGNFMPPEMAMPDPYRQTPDPMPPADPAQPEPDRAAAK